MINQRLEQKLQQKLTPQQIQQIKLLELTTIALEQRIKQEIEENPVLEEVSENEVEDNNEIENENETNDEFDEATDDNDDDLKLNDDDFSVSDFISDDEYGDINYSNSGKESENKEIPTPSNISFNDFLIAQLGFVNINPKMYQITSFVIGNLDEAGYLRINTESIVNDLMFYFNLKTNKAEVEEAIEIVQQLDPAGIGARNLKECLLIQLKRLENQNDDTRFALKLLENNFEDFSEKRYDRLINKYHFTNLQLKAAEKVILKLNPKPGGSIGETDKNVQYIVPDFIVFNNDGKIEISLNGRNNPELRINREYTNMIGELKGGRKETKEAISFVKQKIDSAKWFIDAVKQRYDTLLVTIKAIVSYQYDYFMEGDTAKLKPMILKDIADKTGINISSISRVTSSKYVQTQFGTFLLKSLFSDSYTNESGEDFAFAEVEKTLKEIIEKEPKDKPYNDEQLVVLLKEKGFSFARRTIAKYREQLNIPVARLRKEL